MTNDKHLHFLGIGGHAMRGLAGAAKQLGFTVSGTDPGAYPPGSDWLDASGIPWWRQADPRHLAGVDRVIVSGHTQPDDPELAAARKRGLPIASFAELVGELTVSARRIVVSGTHGKTTTTSLLAWIFEQAGRQPDYLVGIQPHNFPSSVRMRGSQMAVIEGDEYRASQLDTASKFDYYHPDVLVVTGIEMDHPDFFPDLAAITARFEALAETLPASGRLVLHQGVQLPADRLAAPLERYGLAAAGATADWQADQPEFTERGISFRLVHRGTVVGQLQAALYGRHNVANLTAAAAVASGEGVAWDTLTAAAASFTGASRRFSEVSQPGSTVRVFDDYAHHPTEVATTLEAARLHFSGRVLAMYRPHTYSRTKELLNAYSNAFVDADQAFIADIEGAREQHLSHSVSAADVAAIAGRQVAAVSGRELMLERLAAAAQPGDTIVCMSVNGYESFAEELAERVAGQS